MSYFATGAALTAALNALPASLTGTYKAFDAFYYAAQYMGNYTGTLTPIEHFVQIGAARGYQPNADFNPAFYQSKYADLAGLDAADLLFHYVKFGLNEGRAGNATLAAYNWADYLAAYPAVAAYVNANLSSFAGSTTNGAIAHYVKFGAQQGFTLPNTVGQTFTLTASSETKTGTSGNDTFLALNSGDLGNSDIIDGGAGTDTLYAVQALAATSSTIRPVLTSVETLQLQLDETTASETGGHTFTANLDKSSGVKTVDVKNYAFNTAGTGAADTVTVQGVTTATSLKITDDVGGSTTARKNNFTVAYDGVTGTADVAAVTVNNTVAAVTLGNITVAGVESLTVTSNGGANASYAVVAADATALTLNASASSGGAVDLAGAKIATLNINAADSLTVTDAGAASAKLRTVNIDSQTAAKTVTLTSLTPTMTSTAQDLVSEAFTVNVQGAGKASITADNTQFGTQSDTNADSFVVAAGSNTGGVTVNLASMTTAAPRVISVTGGSGDDTVVVAAGALDKYDTVALGAGANTLQTAVAASAVTTTSASNVYYDTTATVDPTITGVSIAKIVMDGGSSHAAAGNIAVNATSASEIAPRIDVAVGDLTDLGGYTLTLSGVASGKTVNFGAFDTTDNSSDLIVTVTDASTGTADSLTVGVDVFETGGTGAAGNIDSISVANVETVTLNVSSTDADVTSVVIDGLNVGAATQVNLAGTINAEITVDGAATHTLNASAYTGTLTINAESAKQTIIGSATKANTFVMGANLDNDDSITGGAATTDKVTATATSLTATTGALHIAAVETLELTNTGTAVVNLAGVTGATNVALAGAGTATTVTNLSAGTKVTLGANTTTFTGGVTIGLADATGASDSLTIDLNGAGTRGTATLTTTGIETLVLNGDSTYEAQTVDVGASTAATINVTGGHATPAAITLATLNAATSLVDASAFTGGVVATAATNTATTFKVRSSSANDITGSVLADTVIVGDASHQAAGAIAHSNEIDGGTGTDTLTVYAADGTDLGTADNFEVVNVIVDAAANASIDLGGSGQGADDAVQVTITGGATGKTLALTGIDSDIGARTIDASGVASTTTLTLGDNVLVQTNASDALNIKGGSSAADVLAYTASNDDSGEVTVSGFETIQVTNGNSASTLNLKNVTGASNIELVGAGQMTISNFSNSQKLVLGTYVDSTATAFSDGTGDTIAVSRAANGTADVLSVDLNTTAAFTLTDNQAETVNLNLVDTAGNDDHGLTLSSTSVTTLNVTGTGTAEDLTVTAAGALLTTVNASTLVGNLTYDVANRAAQAMTITGGTGNDTIGMTYAADVLDGGTKASDNDTLNISFSGTGGALIVDLSSSTDQVQMFNGLANAAVQKNFESVNASAYVQTNSVGADITGSTGANTIVGTAYADTIRTNGGGDTVTGGAGADTIVLGSGVDTIVIGAKTDSGYATTAFSDGGSVASADVVYGLGTGDKINFANFATTANGITVGTSLAADLTADTVNLVRGTYANGAFTAGSAAGDNDYLFQVTETTGTDEQMMIVFVDVVGTVSLAYASEIATITIS